MAKASKKSAINAMALFTETPKYDQRKPVQPALVPA